MKILTAIFVVIALLLAVGGAATTATAEHDRNTIVITKPSRYQGKTAKWWAARAVANRKQLIERRKTIEMRGATIKRLKKSLTRNYTIEECVKLATIAYPSLSESRAWAIIAQESRGNPNARNKTPIWNGEHAEGLWQFIPSTFRSTPYGKAGLSIWSPCASSLAAGWMHEQGRGHEWTGF